jgi:hypothetical protein
METLPPTYQGSIREEILAVEYGRMAHVFNNEDTEWDISEDQLDSNVANLNIFPN